VRSSAHVPAPDAAADGPATARSARVPALDGAGASSPHSRTFSPPRIAGPIGTRGFDESEKSPVSSAMLPSAARFVPVRADLAASNYRIPFRCVLRDVIVSDSLSAPRPRFVRRRDSERGEQKELSRRPRRLRVRIKMFREPGTLLRSSLFISGNPPSFHQRQFRRAVRISMTRNSSIQLASTRERERERKREREKEKESFQQRASSSQSPHSA